MAQLHRHAHADTSKTPASTIATVEQLLRGGESSKVSPSSSSSSSFEWSKHRDTEEDHGHHQKKSVLTKVKEKAKKLRNSLSKKKHDDGNVPPSVGEDDEDTEYLGAPMYESELAPEGYKEKARQHPRASPVISEKHVVPSSVKSGVERDKETPLSPSKSKRITAQHPAGPGKTMPEYTASSSFTSKFQGLSISKPTELHISTAPTTARKSSSALSSPRTPKAKTASQTFYDASMPPRTLSAPLTPQNSLSGAPLSGNKNGSPSDQIWDKGVSVKEYLINKFEPGEDEKALSQVISEAMSPKRTPEDKGVMEKVKDAVTSLLRSDDPSTNAVQASVTTKTSSSEIPVSTNAYEVVEEKSQDRILQAN